MGHLELILIAFFFLIFANFSGKIEKSIFSGPMIFSLFGLLFSPFIFDSFKLNIDNESVKFVAEFTLIILLFTDATGIDLKLLRKEHKIPFRLLSIGLPLCILFGFIIAAFMFDFLNIYEALILATILAPTDAALGQAVVSYDKLPLKIRQAINVESGLNDGIALPFLLLFVSLAAGTNPNADTWYWIKFASSQIIFGILVGGLIGYLGGKFVSYCQQRKIANKIFTDLSAVVLAILAYSLAEEFTGNGFISSFVAGITLGNTSKHICKGVLDFAETEGQLLTLLTFLFFGALIIIPTFNSISLEMFIYSILSLTLIRIVPVIFSLFTNKLDWETLFFIGWFGPRGIATILYGILIINQSNIDNKEFIFNTAMLTVILSIVLHGITAVPWAKTYAKRTKVQ